MPGRTDEIRRAKALAGLLASYPNIAKGDERGDAVAGAYLAAVAKDPAWAVEEVCSRIVRGEAMEVDPRFVPTAAQVVKYVKMVIGRYERELADLLKLQEAA